MLPFAIKGWRLVPKNKIFMITIAGLLGNFFPAYLYCLAETKIDSSLASILNALTPLFAIMVGVLFFRLKITWQKILGVIIGFSGLVILPFAAAGEINFENLPYAFLVLVATICYGTNVHVVSCYLKEITSLQIAAVSFSLFIPVCILILGATGFYNASSWPENITASLLAAFTLGSLGTALASVWFYKLVKSAGSIFASLVTYGIPVIALLWGLVYGEKITPAEAGCLLIILAGVYLVNRKND